MFNRLFLDHPRSVGESYFGITGRQWPSARKCFLGSIACFLHAIVPAAFTQTGSRTVSRLYDRMVVNRAIQFAKATRIAPT